MGHWRLVIHLRTAHALTENESDNHDDNIHNDDDCSDDTNDDENDHDNWDVSMEAKKSIKN